MVTLRSFPVIVCLVALLFVVSVVPCQAAGRFFGISHTALVNKSGIHPNRVGGYEGVGVSSVSFEDARNKACYWGKRNPVSVQYNQRGGMFYVVVRYN